MRNNSHSPGCMRALPASQSCQVRIVEWILSAASRIESPATSLAARISEGVGLEEGPFGPRFGWLATADGVFEFLASFIGQAAEGESGPDHVVAIFGGIHQEQSAFDLEAVAVDFDTSFGFLAGKLGLQIAAIRDASKKAFVVSDGVGLGHFNLLAPVGPEARRMRCIHDLNYTRNPCMSKNFLRKIFEAPTPPHNAKLTCPPRVGKGRDDD